MKKQKQPLLIRTYLLKFKYAVVEKKSIIIYQSVRISVRYQAKTKALKCFQSWAGAQVKR